MGATTGKLEFGWRKIFPRSNNLCANKKMAEGDRGEPLVFMGLPIAGTVGALSQPLAAAGVTVSTLPSATILLAWLYLLTYHSIFTALSSRLAPSCFVRSDSHHTFL